MLKIKIPAQDNWIGISRLLITAFARQEGLSEEDVYDLKLAGSEVVSRMVAADSAKDINLSIMTEGSDIKLTISSQADNVDNQFKSKIFSKEMLKLLVDKLSVETIDNSTGFILYKKKS